MTEADRRKHDRLSIREAAKYAGVSPKAIFALVSLLRRMLGGEET